MDVTFYNNLLANTTRTIVNRDTVAPLFTLVEMLVFVRERTNGFFIIVLANKCMYSENRNVIISMILTYTYSIKYN